MVVRAELRGTRKPLFVQIGLERHLPPQKRDVEFDTAFEAEYGVTPSGMADFVSRMGELALEAGNGRITLPRSRLIEEMAAAAGVSAQAAEASVSNWSLIPRSRWDEDKPAGANKKDWYPWRFARRLSLLSRPIVQLSSGENPQCVVSPVVAEHGLEYALRAYNARLPDAYFRTKEMRSWVGGAINRLGHGFNRRVAARLVELGLEAEPEFLMTRLGGAAKDGDVDVLAWDRTSGQVYAIECKRLLADKTVGEIAERLVEFARDQLEKSGKRGPAKKPLDRIATLRGRLGSVATATGIATDRLQLRSCLVTSALVPMQFQRSVATYFDIVANYDSLASHFYLRGDAQLSDDSRCSRKTIPAG